MIHGSHHYTIKVKGNKKTLYFSCEDFWAEASQGKKIASIKNTGNGIKIKRFNKFLGYGDALELNILLTCELGTKFEIL